MPGSLFHTSGQSLEWPDHQPSNYSHTSPYTAHRSFFDGPHHNHSPLGANHIPDDRSDHPAYHRTHHTSDNYAHHTSDNCAHYPSDNYAHYPSNNCAHYRSHHAAYHSTC